MVNWAYRRGGGRSFSESHRSAGAWTRWAKHETTGADRPRTQQSLTWLQRV